MNKGEGVFVEELKIKKRSEERKRKEKKTTIITKVSLLIWHMTSLYVGYVKI